MSSQLNLLILDNQKFKKSLSKFEINKTIFRI